MNLICSLVDGSFKLIDRQHTLAYFKAKSPQKIEMFTIVNCFGKYDFYAPMKI